MSERHRQTCASTRHTVKLQFSVSRELEKRQEATSLLGGSVPAVEFVPPQLPLPPAFRRGAFLRRSLWETSHPRARAVLQTPDWGTDTPYWGGTDSATARAVPGPWMAQLPTGRCTSHEPPRLATPALLHSLILQQHHEDYKIKSILSLLQKTKKRPQGHSAAQKA